MNTPSGIVTFLFTDIEGSTKLSQKYPHLLQGALEKHHAILTESINSNNGFVFEIIGDAFCASFENPADAIKAAYEIQIRLQNEKWNEVHIKVRIGINRGEAEWSGTRYIGYITLAKTQRIISVAYGGQVLISEDVIRDIDENDFDEITFKDLGERRLKDIVKPFHIFQLVSDKLNSTFPPLKTLDARPYNLPVQLTSFVGRSEELLQLKNLIKKTHLLTLKGLGGSGKTRLAIKVASDIIDEFSDGVWFIDLTSIRDEALLPQALSSVLKIGDSSQIDKDEFIINFLRNKEALIILDNCEQLVEACADMAEKLLLNCPKLKMIATSREALNCQGESVFNVLSMKIPKPGSKIPYAKLTQYEAVNLFIERALTVNPYFTVNNENAAALAEICYRLDGIPLAIELAAARMKVLSLEKIYERLDDRFKLLTGGIRTAFPKQQTLKAMVDWSYDLLSDDEKILLNRLSVFAGGWTLDAAEKVCSDEKLKEDQILDLLSNLSDKSLVLYIKESERYRMLETIRQYGEEKLVESGELENIIIKHLNYFLTYADYGRDQLSGEMQKEWIKNFESENSNFQLALTSSIVRNHRLSGIRLAISLSRYWEIRGYISVAKNWLKEFFSEKDSIPLPEKASVLQWLGTFEWITGDFNKAQAFYEEGFNIVKQLEDKTGVAVALNNLASIANLTGKYEYSKQLREESYKIFEEIGNKSYLADALFNLGSTIINLNEMERAKEIFEDCVKKYRELGDIRGVGMSLYNLGSLAGLKGDYELSRTYFEECLSIQMELGDTRLIASTLSNLGAMMGYLGYNAKAAEYLEESIKINNELGDKKGLSEARTKLGFVKSSQQEYGISLNLYKESLKLQIEIDDKVGISHNIIGIADVISRNNPEDAVFLISKVEPILKSISDVLEPEIQLKYDKTISFLKEKLDNETFTEKFENGKSMTLEEINKLALIQGIGE